jgi:hypothetical protein
VKQIISVLLLSKGTAVRKIRVNFVVTVFNYSSIFKVKFSELFIQTKIKQSPVQIMIHEKVERIYTYSAEHNIGVF